MENKVINRATVKNMEGKVCICVFQTEGKPDVFPRKI